MRFISLSKRNILAIFAGTVAAVIIQAISFNGIAYIDRQIISQIPHTATIEQFKAAYTSEYAQQPYAALSAIVRIGMFLAPLIGGFIVGLLAQKKGWLYGGISGVIFLCVGILMFLYTAFFIPQFPNEEKAIVPQVVLNYFLSFPMTFVLSSVGGYLGERLQQLRSKRKFT